ncbi:MAG: hypothetical protein ACLVAW_12235 [Eisenbergiella massiliensis]
MRRNLKKPVALLTAALTAASLLAGCGSSAGESTDAGAQVKETSNANEAAETTAGGSDAEGGCACGVTYPLAEEGAHLRLPAQS